MRKLTTFVAAAALLGTGTAALADDTKIGILMDITGPIANFIPPLQNAADLAVKQVNEQGGLLGARQLPSTVTPPVPHRARSTLPRSW